MAFELIYTSAVAGVRSGSTGFCTVAMTEGMPPALISRLEALTGYRHLYPPTDSRYAQNPPAFIHYRLSQGNSLYSILGRVCSCAPDHTGRSNKLAHFLVVSQQEVLGLPNGPAAFRDAASPFVTEWTGSPRVIGGQHTLRTSQASGGVANRWAGYTGDAGWAGVLAQRFLDNPRERTYILFDPNRHSALLELVDEAIHLLPESHRWKVTYNTYGTSLPADLLCNWIFCLPDAESRRAAGALGNATVINLCEPLPYAGNGALQEQARTGQTQNVTPSPYQGGQHVPTAYTAPSHQANATSLAALLADAPSTDALAPHLQTKQEYCASSQPSGASAPMPPSYPGNAYYQAPQPPPPPAQFIPTPPQTSRATEKSSPNAILCAGLAFLLGLIAGFLLRPFFAPNESTSQQMQQPARNQQKALQNIPQPAAETGEKPLVVSPDQPKPQSQKQAEQQQLTPDTKSSGGPGENAVDEKKNEGANSDEKTTPSQPENQETAPMSPINQPTIDASNKDPQTNDLNGWMKNLKDNNTSGKEENNG